MTDESPSRPPLLAPTPVPDRAVLRRNFLLGIANGILFTLSEALADANLVLTLFIRQLGGSNVLVGLLPALKNGGWLIPQIFVAGRIQAMPLKLRVYRTAALFRILTWIILTAAVYGALWLGPQIALLTFFVTYTLFTLSGGSSSLAFQDIVAKIVPVRRRGVFFSYRQLFGGLLAFAIAAPIVRTVLKVGSPWPFPSNYGLICAISLIFLVLGLLSFAVVDEPPQAGVVGNTSPLATLRQMPVLLRTDVDFRRFMSNRLLARVASIAEPFYIVYASEELRIAPRFVGIYLAVRVLSAALSNLWWGRLGDRQGNRRLLVVTTALVAVVPWAVLIIPAITQPLGPTWLGYSFGLVFLLIGLSVDGSGTASLTYLLEIAPADQRPTYIGLANTLLGMVTFIPVLGGLLLPLLGYRNLFLLAGIMAICSWIATLRLREPMRL